MTQPVPYRPLAPLEDWRKGLEEAEETARFLDGRGWLPGWDPVIGVIPVVGDIISFILALRILRIAHKLGIPDHLFIIMGALVLVDLAIGFDLFPPTWILNQLLDAGFRANRWNVTIMRRYLMTLERAGHE